MVINSPKWTRTLLLVFLEVQHILVDYRKHNKRLWTATDQQQFLFCLCMCDIHIKDSENIVETVLLIVFLS